MQIFLCISSFFYRLFRMNNAKKYHDMSFWQSDSWKNILEQSWQALHVEAIEYSWWRMLMEFRQIGLAQIWAFSLGVDIERMDEHCIIEAMQVAKKYGALFWQVEYMNNAGSLTTEMYECNSPYKHFLEPYTRILDLTLRTDALLTQMHEKWRYNIRLAMKRGVTVEWVDVNAENIDTWMGLLTQTASRDGFVHNSRAYYEAFLRERTNVELAFAYYEGHVIAAGIFVYLAESALYYYGASSSDAETRKHMAPYLLQWHAIEEGKRRGCTLYDFLGIASPGSHDHHLAWVTAFKEKFGGEIVELGPKILYPLSWKYWIFLSIRKMKNMLIRNTRGE